MPNSSLETNIWEFPPSSSHSVMSRSCPEVKYILDVVDTSGPSHHLADDEILTAAKNTLRYSFPHAFILSIVKIEVAHNI